MVSKQAKGGAEAPVGNSGDAATAADSGPLLEPSAAAGAPRLPPALASGYPNRIAGCLLSKMCGDVLGAGVEGRAAEDVLMRHPEGITDFLQTKRGYGCYTDDTQMAIALARSLAACGGRINDVHAARCYATEYQANRGYGGTAYKILSGIQRSGIDAVSIRTIGTKYIPAGSFGNGGAMRIAPLGLVYRHAPPAVLREAVAAALRCTHVHPVAIDGAFVIAAAVGYLATRQPADPAAAAAEAAAAAAAADAAEADGAAATASVTAAATAAQTAAAGAGPEAVVTPVGLLDYLLSYSSGHLETEGMAHKLRTVRAALLQGTRFKAPGEPWSRYFGSAGWAAERALQEAIAAPFQIRADDAAAAALSALACHWGRPEDALVAAVHFGGDTDTVAAITGALAGSLYGTSWLPARWWTRLENGPAGRDEMVTLAEQLAQLDTRS